MEKDKIREQIKAKRKIKALLSSRKIAWDRKIMMINEEILKYRIKFAGSR